MKGANSVRRCMAFLLSFLLLIVQSPSFSVAVYAAETQGGFEEIGSMEETVESTVGASFSETEEITDEISDEMSEDEEVTDEAVSADLQEEDEILEEAGEELSEDDLSVTDEVREETAVTEEAGTEEALVGDGAGIDGISTWQALQNALDAAGDTGGTVTLTQDLFSGNDSMLEIKTGKTVTLDLNGKELDRDRSSGDSDGHVIIIYENATLTITDSSADQTGTIKGGFATNGGGINVNQPSSILYFDGGTITGCKAEKGGGILTRGTVYMRGGKITGNKATSTGQGGGVHVTDTGKFIMTGGEISGNTANDGGGIFSDGSNSEVEISGNSLISGNEVVADHAGGGIRLGGRLTMNGGIISGNSAVGNGGAIWADDNAELNIVGAEFSNNTCGGSGGAIYAKCGLNMRDADVSGNEAQNCGGGIYLYSGNSTISSGEISGNKSNDGGGIYVNQGAELTENADIKDNTVAAVNGGGGITNHGKLKVDGGMIRGNSSVADGGGIWSGEGTELYLYGGEITDNRCQEAQSHGVYCGTKPHMKGDPVIQDNNGTNLYLDWVEIIIDGPLSENAKVGVSASYQGTFTENMSAYCETESGTLYNSENGVAMCFTSDDVDLGIYRYVGGELVLDQEWIGLYYAIRNAPEGATVKLKYDVKGGSADIPIAIEAGHKVTLDLNGHTLNRNLSQAVASGNAIKVYGELTVIDSAATKIGRIIGANVSDSGDPGAVYVADGGILTLEGGGITQNKSEKGAGGVYVADGGTFHFNGGNVMGNTCTDEERSKGVFADANAMFAVSGAPKSDGILLDRSVMHVTGTLADGCSLTVDSIAVTESGSPVTITAGYHDVMGNADPSSFFTPYNSTDTAVSTGDSGEAVLAMNWAGLRNYIENEAQQEEVIKLEADFTAKSDDEIISVTGKAVTIDLNGHTLNRNRESKDQTGRVFAINGSGILTLTDSSEEKSGMITGGWADNGGAVFVAEDSTLNFTGGTIKENKADYGGGIYNNGTVNINGGVINKNRAVDGGAIYSNKGTVTLTDGKITGNTSTGEHAGGGIFNRDKFIMSGGEISGNTANRWGGAIHNSTENGTTTITGGVIKENQAVEGGGAMYMTGGTVKISGGKIQNNESGDGGAIYISQGTVEVSGDAEFTGNKAVEKDAGAIENKGTLTINGGKFLNNEASHYGGAVYSSGTLNLYGGKITGNTAKGLLGGGIYVSEHDRSSVNIKGAPIVTDNEDDNLYFPSGKKINVVDALDESALIGVNHGGKRGVFTSGLKDKGSASNFVSDIDEYYIGVNESKEGEITTYWREIQKRVAEAPNLRTITLERDAIAATDDTTIEINGKEIKIDLNGYTLDRKLSSWDKDGHVIIIMPNSTLTITDSSEDQTGTIKGGFTTNGGGINVNAESSTLNLEGGTITGCEAEYGGGILTRGTVNMSGGKITGNKATSNGKGGGVHVTSSGKFFMTGGEISGNTANDGGGIFADGSTSVVEISGDSLISGNKVDADHGGGGIRLGGNLTMDGGTISGNSAGGNGGGIWADSAAKLSIKGASITGNSAGRNGGGICTFSNSDVSITDSEISNNAAAQNGGGINKSSEAQVSIKGSKISNNTATEAGGGIYADAVCRISGTMVNGNTASEEAGGIYIDSGEFLIDEDSEVCDNTAGTYNGGGILNKGTLELDGVKVSGNTAYGLGGGIFAEKGTLNLYGADVTDNYAKQLGDGIYVSAGDINIKGKLRVTGNEEDNIYLPDSIIMKLKSGGLSTETLIGISQKTPGRFLDNSEHYTGIQLGYFSSDDPAYRVAWDDPVPGEHTALKLVKNQEFTFGFNPNGGSGTMDDVTVIQGSKYLMPANRFTAPEGKAFDGWKKEGSDEKVYPGDEVTVDGAATWMAQWKDAVDAAVLETASVIFEGMIRMRYKFSLPEDMTDGFVVFEKDGKEVDRIAIAEGKPISGYTSFDYGVLIPEYADQVLVKLVDANGDPIPLLNSKGADITDGYSLSVKDYAVYMTEYGSTAKMKALARALDDYGTAAQIHFKYGDYSSLSVRQVVKSLKVDEIQCDPASAAGAKPDGLTSVSATLFFHEDNKLRAYFSGSSLSDFSYKLDGRDVTAKKKGERVYVDVEAIAAPELADRHSFTVTDGLDTYVVTTSGIAYAKLAAANGSDTMKDLAKALYLYYLAADDYFN